MKKYQKTATNDGTMTSPICKFVAKVSGFYYIKLRGRALIIYKRRCAPKRRSADGFDHRLEIYRKLSYKTEFSN